MHMTSEAAFMIKLEPKSTTQMTRLARTSWAAWTSAVRPFPKSLDLSPNRRPLSYTTCGMG